jgi:hypothetical protein
MNKSLLPIMLVDKRCTLDLLFTRNNRAIPIRRNGCRGMFVYDFPLPVLFFKAICLTNKHGAIVSTIFAHRVPLLNRAYNTHITIYEGFRFQDVSFE